MDGILSMHCDIRDMDMDAASPLGFVLCVNRNLYQ
jgi:hypothetical protein